MDKDLMLRYSKEIFEKFVSNNFRRIQHILGDAKFSIELTNYVLIFVISEGQSMDPDNENFTVMRYFLLSGNSDGDFGQIEELDTAFKHLVLAVQLTEPDIGPGRRL